MAIPVAGNNLRNRHFIVYHVTEYSTILGVFWQPCPAVSMSRPAILKTEKALGRGFKLLSVLKELVIFRFFWSKLPQIRTKYLCRTRNTYRTLIEH